MSTSGAPRTSSRKTMVVLSRMAGRQSRAPFSRSANISGRTSTSERIGQKPETIVPGLDGDVSRGRLGHLAATLRCANAGRARRGGPALRLRSCFFESLVIGHARSVHVEQVDWRRRHGGEVVAAATRCAAEIGQEVTIHTTGGEVDPGNLQSRWAPYERTHGSSQGQLPKDRLRPRGNVSPVGKRRPSTPNIGAMRESAASGRCGVVCDILRRPSHCQRMCLRDVSIGPCERSGACRHAWAARPKRSLGSRRSTEICKRCVLKARRPMSPTRI